VCPTHADGADEREPLCLSVELRELGAAAGAGDAPLGVDAHASHAREIDDDAGVARGETGDAVAAATNRDGQVLLARKTDGRNDVVDAGRPDDERGPPVDHRVPDHARRVVLRIRRKDDLAGEALREGSQRAAVGCSGLLPGPDELLRQDGLSARPAATSSSRSGRSPVS
jgi:hypothetical protein